MQQIFAIINLTWKAAFRYRLFWVVTALLLGAVVGLPLLVKDDGTADGFVQILLTYTLTAVTILLGVCTLWLACGTLARDVEECQIQMLAVKPVARWQIWLGKWLGLVTLNAALLALAGASIYGLLEWRATKLPPAIQLKLKNEVLVSRGSARERSFDAEIDKEADRRMGLLRNKDSMTGLELRAARQQFKDQEKAELQVVAPAHARTWVIHLGAVSQQLKDQPLYLRVKFNVAETPGLGATYGALWFAGIPQKSRLYRSELMSLSPDTFHEFAIDPNVFDENGDLVVHFLNPNETAVLFALDEGMEVLYRVGGFGLNFIRGLGIILCWMSLVAALGLAAASLLSFPVAAFFSLAVLTMGLCSGTLNNVVTDGTIMGWNEERGTKGHSAIDEVAVPAFKGMLKVINLVKDFSPIDSLSTGREISWPELGLAVAQIVLLLGGLIGAVGIFIFSRRELATAQGTR
jgi:hypothetical protein